MIADENANIFDSFKKSSNLIDRVNSFNKQPLISFQTRKRSLIDTENEVVSSQNCCTIFKGVN